MNVADINLHTSGNAMNNCSIKRSSQRTSVSTNDIEGDTVINGRIADDNFVKTSQLQVLNANIKRIGLSLAKSIQAQLVQVLL